MNRSFLLCGVGGQGTVLASRVLAQTAMERGEDAGTAETIGMAQRGGCVVSHVRIGSGINSALVPEGGADLLIGFEPSEAVRCMKYLKPDGVCVVSSRAVQPVTAALTGKRLDSGEMIAYLKKHLSRVIVVDTEEICESSGSPKVLNVALLGAAAESGRAGISISEIQEVLRKRLPEKLIDMNLKALRLGAEAASEE